MRLSCNFVNMYSIAYRIQYIHVYTRASITDILARKIAHVGQVGEDPRACPASGKLNGEVAGHADILATILARKSARMSMSVSVSVSAPWNASFIRHKKVFYQNPKLTYTTCVARVSSTALQKFDRGLA